MASSEGKLKNILRAELREYSDGDVLIQEGRNMPDWRELKTRVDSIVSSSTWWERFGVDWFVIAVSVGLIPQCLNLVASEEWWHIAFGMALYGCVHGVLANKAGHAATHDGLCDSPRLSKFLSTLLVEFIGGFSDTIARETHISGHHPYTNILHRGDSSIWKVPMLPRTVYMFIAPIFLPFFTPWISALYLVKRPKELLLFVLVAGSGALLHLSIVVYYCGYSWPMAVFVLYGARGFIGIPYIHVNIFQHIGLHMWENEHRPPRVMQMSDGVLNLHRTPLLDWCFGHALISCHVEHHFFPKLSDNMCLKVKPVVRSFLKERGLPYHEDSYMNRLDDFCRRYEELMVDAPPITHFVGIQ